ncbi:hypothetical protein SAMN05444580_11550 [Rhodococcus tukisamuensis]|uniref:Uncharacterized protein n=1 Tax=Rhodococcus tukisamuensis TaxID=168276 RepID=A0A1G7C9F0_9NOCA|nr:hypothetical protein SAMN05444580_11550 [Rhodococcus tukisamuensis]
MRSPRAGRLASMVVASAVLVGGLAAGSGAASAAPAGSLLPAESVAAVPTGSMDQIMANPLRFLGYLIAVPIILLGTASHEPWDGAGQA